MPLLAAAGAIAGVAGCRSAAADAFRFLLFSFSVLAGSMARAACKVLDSTFDGARLFSCLFYFLISLLFRSIVIIFWVHPFGEISPG